MSFFFGLYVCIKPFNALFFGMFLILLFTPVCYVTFGLLVFIRFCCIFTAKVTLLQVVNACSALLHLNIYIYIQMVSKERD